MTNTNTPRFISFHDLKSSYGETRSRTQLRRDVAAGIYPSPKQISAGRVGWETAVLDKHYDNRPTVAYAGKKKRAA